MQPSTPTFSYVIDIHPESTEVVTSKTNKPNMSNRLVRKETDPIVILTQYAFATSAVCAITSGIGSLAGLTLQAYGQAYNKEYCEGLCTIGAEIGAISGALEVGLYLCYRTIKQICCTRKT